MADVYFLTQLQSSLILVGVPTESTDGVVMPWNYSMWDLFCADLLKNFGSY